MIRLSKLIILFALLPLVAAAQETEQRQQVREDLEKQLKTMVGTPPTKIRVEFVGLDQPNYELTEASFKLDGRNLPVQDLRKLNTDGEHLIFHGDVQPGTHKLESKFEFVNRTSQVVSVEGGYKWKVGSEVSFPTESGIEVRIKVTPELNQSADIKNRITVKSPATVKMLAKLDDGSMPPPADRPNLAIAGEPDAGVKETAAEKAAKAAEAKKKAREEALAEKKRKADEAKAARLAAAAEKKQAAEDAKAAKKAAAEEKKRAAAEALAAKNNPKVAANDTPTAVEPVAEVVDAGPAVAVAEVDAGAPVVVAVADPPKPVEPVAPPPAEESGLPLPLLIGIGVAVLGLLLFLLARRKKNEPPS